MDGTEIKYIVAIQAGETEKPVFVYEFRAQEATSVNDATSYDSLEDAEESANLLNQMNTLMGETNTFVVKKVTTIIEGAE